MTAAATLPTNTPDPFTQVHDAIWATLEGHAPLASMVRLGNRIKRTTGDGRGSDGITPVKQGLSHGDMPELDLMSAGGAVNQKGSLIEITHTWEIALRTDDPYLDVQTFPVYWELIRAFVTAPCDLGLPGLVDNSRLGNYTTDEQLERAIARGWLTLLTIETRMTLEKAKIAV